LFPAEHEEEEGHQHQEREERDEATTGRRRRPATASGRRIRRGDRPGVPAFGATFWNEKMEAVS